MNGFNIVFIPARNGNPKVEQKTRGDRNFMLSPSIVHSILVHMVINPVIHGILGFDCGVFKSKRNNGFENKTGV